MIVCLPGGQFVWAVQVTILDVVDLKNPGAHGLHWGRAVEDPLPLTCMYLPGGHGSDGGMRVCHVNNLFGSQLVGCALCV